MTAHSKRQWTGRAILLAALAAALSACASTPAALSHVDRSAIRRVGVVSLMEDAMHAYFMVGPVLREKVGASLRENFLGPPILGNWPINRNITDTVRGALGRQYRYVALDYNAGRLMRKAYQFDPDHISLEHIKDDLRRIGEGKVDAILLISGSGSVTQVVGRQIWLAGYGFYRQSILPGAPTVDYAAMRLSVLDMNTLRPLATRAVFTYRRLPASLWTIDVTNMTLEQQKTLRSHVRTLLQQTAKGLVHDVGLGEESNAKKN